MKVETMESFDSGSIHPCHSFPHDQTHSNCYGCPKGHQQRAASSRITGPQDEDTKHGWWMVRRQWQNPQGSTNQGSQDLGGVVGPDSCSTTGHHPQLTSSNKNTLVSLIPLPAP